jgi:hypothetical protein
VLLDEVVAHLDPTAAGAVRRMAKLGAQVWMTGADPAAFAESAPPARFLTTSSQAGDARRGCSRRRVISRRTGSPGGVFGGQNQRRTRFLQGRNRPLADLKYVKNPIYSKLWMETLR